MRSPGYEKTQAGISGNTSQAELKFAHLSADIQQHLHGADLQRGLPLQNLFRKVFWLKNHEPACFLIFRMLGHFANSLESKMTHASGEIMLLEKIKGEKKGLE